MPCKLNLNAARNVTTVFRLVTRSIRKWLVSIFKTMPKIAIYKYLKFYFFTADWFGSEPSHLHVSNTGSLWRLGEKIDFYLDRISGLTG